MRLCYLAPEFLPTWGGVGIYSVNLIKQLSKRKDVEIHVITPERGKDYNKQKVLDYFNNKIQIHNISKASDTFFYNFYFQNAVAKNFGKLNQKYKFDLIHSANLVHMPDIWLKFRKLSIPSLVTVHTTIDSQSKVAGGYKLKTRIGEKAPVEFLSNLTYPYIKSLQNKYIKETNNFIAVSKWITSFLPSQKNIQVINNGIDTKVFTPKKHKNEVPMVLFSGRLLAMKGVDGLIEAIKIVLQNHKAKFIFAGTGNIEKYERKLNLERISKDNYEFLGYVPYEKINQLYAKSDIFVLPSYSESFPLTLLEAMSCECAIIASNVGGIPEIIENNKNGLLFNIGDYTELADKINFLIENEGKRRLMALNARKKVLKNFTSEKMANKAYRFYRRILK